MAKRDSRIGALSSRLFALRGRIFAALAQRRIGLALVFASLAALLTATPLGRYVDETLYFDPANRLRAAAGLTPALDPRIRLIVVDDASIERFGRSLRLGEWRRIAATLFDRGFDKVILHSFPNLSSDVIDSAAELIMPGGKSFITAAARHGTVEGNPRSIPVRNIPPRLLVPKPAESESGFPEARVLLGPANGVISLIDALGHINMNEGASAPIAFELDEVMLLPHIALWAAPGLKWRNHRLVNDLGTIPSAAGRIMHADFVSPADVARASLPARAFFETDNTIREVLSPNVGTMLRGGTIAILVPDAFTGGSRVVPSPFGLVPSYMVSLALANGVLAHRYVVHPLPPELVTLLAAALCAAIFLLSRSRHLALGAGVAVFVIIGASFAALHLLGWIMPCASLVALLIAGAATHQIYAAIDVWKTQITNAKDLELGRVVQSMIVPRTLKGTVGAWEYEVAYEPHGAMSGDWIQIYCAEAAVPGRPLAVIAIGDVVGKGPSAALNTAAIAASWVNVRAQWEAGEFSLEAFLQTLNRVMYGTFGGEQLSTMSLAVLEADRATLVNCSGPAWLHVGPVAKVQNLSVMPTNPIGIGADYGRLKPKVVSAGRGEVLLAYTDGVMDGSLARRNFGKRVEAAGLPEGDIFPYLVQEARAAGVGNALPDDFTLLMLRRTA